MAGKSGWASIFEFNETDRGLKDGNDVIVESPQHDILEKEDQLEEKVSNNAIFLVSSWF